MYLRHGVAGIDRALKGVRGIDACDVGNLTDIELGCQTRRNVLARCGGGKQDVAVVLSHSQYLGRHVLGQTMGQAFCIGVQNFGNTSDLRRCRSCSTCVGASYQHMHIAATLQCSSNGVEGCALDRGVVVFCNN